MNSTPKAEDSQFQSTYAMLFDAAYSGAFSSQLDLSSQSNHLVCQQPMNLLSGTLLQMQSRDSTLPLSAASSVPIEYPQTSWQ